MKNIYINPDFDKIIQKIKLNKEDFKIKIMVYRYRIVLQMKKKNRSIINLYKQNEFIFKIDLILILYIYGLILI